MASQDIANRPPKQTKHKTQPAEHDLGQDEAVGHRRQTISVMPPTC